MLVHVEIEHPLPGGLYPTYQPGHRLTPEERTKLLDAMQKHEGWRVGQSGGVAASAGKTGGPINGHAQLNAQGAGPEVTKAVLGYIALTDAAPLMFRQDRNLAEFAAIPGIVVMRPAPCITDHFPGGVGSNHKIVFRDTLR